jgi:hypothetical protein
LLKVLEIQYFFDFNEQNLLFFLLVFVKLITSDYGLLLEELSIIIALGCIMINLFYILVDFQVVMRDEVEDMPRYLEGIRKVYRTMLMG